MKNILFSIILAMSVLMSNSVLAFDTVSYSSYDVQSSTAMPMQDTVLKNTSATNDGRYDNWRISNLDIRPSHDKKDSHNSVAYTLKMVVRGASIGFIKT